MWRLVLVDGHTPLVHFPHILHRPQKQPGNDIYDETSKIQETIKLFTLNVLTFQFDKNGEKYLILPSMPTLIKRAVTNAIADLVPGKTSLTVLARKLVESAR